MTQINANTKNTAAAVEFENGQSVTVTGGRHAGKQAWFNKLSGGGNGEAYCFIWFKGTANMSGARVKVSDIAPEAVEQPAAFVQATNERDVDKNLMQRVRSLLLSEGISLHQQDKARATLQQCVLPKKCLQAYDLILEQEKIIEVKSNEN